MSTIYVAKVPRKDIVFVISVLAIILKSVWWMEYVILLWLLMVVKVVQHFVILQVKNVFVSSIIYSSSCFINLRSHERTSIKGVAERSFVFASEISSTISTVPKEPPEVIHINKMYEMPWIGYIGLKPTNFLFIYENNKSK